MVSYIHMEASVSVAQGLETPTHAHLAIRCVVSICAHTYCEHRPTIELVRGMAQKVTDSTLSWHGCLKTMRDIDTACFPEKSNHGLHPASQISFVQSRLGRSRPVTSFARPAHASNSLLQPVCVTVWV